MTQYQFKAVMLKLINVYGEKSYPEERLSIIYNSVNQYDHEAFNSFVDELIGKERYAPMADKFKEFSMSQSRLHAESRAEENAEMLRQGRACRYCENEGVVMAERIEDGTKWSFLCDKCDLINNRKFNSFPMKKWSDALSDKYRLYIPHPKIYTIRGGNDGK